MPELSIVIPAYNEESTIAGVIAAHRDVARALAPGSEILACDDGSGDGTWEAMRAAAAHAPEVRLLRHDANRGIPATMKRLYAEASGEWIYFAPADGQVPAAALEIMWRAREGAALVVGRRVPRRDPAARILMAQVYSAVLRAVFRLPARDIDSVKLYRSAELRAVPARSASNFLEAEILISLVRRGRVVREVVIPHRPRIAGRAKGVTVLGALHAALDLGAFILRDFFGGRR